MKTMILEPDYEATALWFAEGMRQHSFDRFATEPVISFIEQIRYLTLKDIEATQRIIDKLTKHIDPPRTIYRCVQAETTHDCPRGHRWVDDHGERRAYHNDGSR